MEYSVYLLTNEANAANELSVNGDYILQEWKPSLISQLPNGIIADEIGFLKNWFYHLPRFLFKGKKYIVYALRHKRETVCQCILTPFSYRYPFMGKDDLQFGLVYTSPKHRNKKLANYMIKRILNNFRSGVNFWWITEIDNLPSRRLAERVGFKYFKRAIKKGFLGISYYKCIEPEDLLGFSSNE